MLQRITTELHQVPITTPTEQLIQMWVHGMAEGTQENYKRIATQFLESVGVPLLQVGLLHLQEWVDGLAVKNTTKRNYSSVIKSLLSFVHKLGLMPYNPGVALKAPKCRETLTERIMSESEVLTILRNEENERNRLILRVLYYCGLRASEVAGLTWKDAIARVGGGQLSVFGKGGKTRVVLVPIDLWRELEAFKGDSNQNEPIFRSAKGGALSRIQVWRIVKKSCATVGIFDPSPHWFRHSHASHSLDRGAPIHLVSSSLGHSSVATTSKYLHARPEDCSSLYLPK